MIGFDVAQDVIARTRNRPRDGSILGLVRFPLSTADNQWQTTVSTYVPQHLYRPMRRRYGNRDEDRH